jgi:hypothetical protein
VNEGWDYPRFNPNIPSFQRCFHLVGGLEYVLFSISYMGCHPIDELIFFKMVKINHQPAIVILVFTAYFSLLKSSLQSGIGFFAHTEERTLKLTRWAC